MIQTLKFLLVFSACLLLLQVPSLADEGREQIHQVAENVQPLLPGMKAPKFTVLDAKGVAVNFDPEQMEKPLVLTFYRGGWCPYCNLHLAELRKAESELEALGFDSWFISMDKPELLYESLDDPDIGYRVLSDVGVDATRSFGVAFKVPEDKLDKYKSYGIDLAAVSSEGHHVLPAPSTFLIGRDGIIRFQYTNPDYSLRLYPDVLLAAARSYQLDAEQRLRKGYREREAKH